VKIIEERKKSETKKISKIENQSESESANEMNGGVGVIKMAAISEENRKMARGESEETASMK
jgi:hypothetical protein